MIRTGSSTGRLLPFLFLIATAAGSDPAGPVCVGHLTPDTDSIAGAVAAAHHFGGTAVRTGPMNPESALLLERFGYEAPEVRTDFAGARVVLVDHNQTTQMPPSMADARIEAVIDHHALRSKPFSTDVPILVDIRPWGSTCTILYDRMRRAGQEVPPRLAGLLLGGLISDTLILSSPTTTEHDRRIADELASIAGINDLKSFGIELVRAKSQLGHKSPQEVLLSDYKVYELSGKTVGFGVAETVHPDALLERRDAIMERMKLHKGREDLDLMFFAVIDVLEKRAHIFVLEGPEALLASRAYPDGAGRHGRTLLLEGVVSRKRQLLPPIQRELESPPPR